MNSTLSLESALSTIRGNIESILNALIEAMSQKKSENNRKCERGKAPTTRMRIQMAYSSFSATIAVV